MKVVSTSNAPAAIGLTARRSIWAIWCLFPARSRWTLLPARWPIRLKSRLHRALQTSRPFWPRLAFPWQMCQDCHFSGRYQRFCRCECRVCQGLCGAVPCPQLRAGGRHPQGRKAGDRVHRRARIIRPKHKRGCAAGTAPFACMRKNENSNYGRRPMPPSSVRVSPDRYLKSGMASCTHTRPISVSGLA